MCTLPHSFFILLCGRFAGFFFSPVAPIRASMIFFFIMISNYSFVSFVCANRVIAVVYRPHSCKQRNLKMKRGGSARGGSAVPREGCTVWVGGLNSNYTKESLMPLFAQAGSVASIKVIPQQQQGSSYAFVNYHDPSSVQRALKLSLPHPMIVSYGRGSDRSMPPGSNVMHHAQQGSTNAHQARGGGAARKNNGGPKKPRASNPQDRRDGVQGIVKEAGNVWITVSCNVDDVDIDVTFERAQISLPIVTEGDRVIASICREAAEGGWKSAGPLLPHRDGSDTAGKAGIVISHCVFWKGRFYPLQSFSDDDGDDTKQASQLMSLCATRGVEPPRSMTKHLSTKRPATSTNHHPSAVAKSHYYMMGDGELVDGILCLGRFSVNEQQVTLLQVARKHCEAWLERRGDERVKVSVLGTIRSILISTNVPYSSRCPGTLLLCDIVCGQQAPQGNGWFPRYCEGLHRPQTADDIAAQHANGPSHDAGMTSFTPLNAAELNSFLTGGPRGAINPPSLKSTDLSLYAPYYHSERWIASWNAAARSPHWVDLATAATQSPSAAIKHLESVVAFLSKLKEEKRALVQVEYNASDAEDVWVRLLQAVFTAPPSTDKDADVGVLPQVLRTTKCRFDDQKPEAQSFIVKHQALVGWWLATFWCYAKDRLRRLTLMLRDVFDDDTLGDVFHTVCTTQWSSISGPLSNDRTSIHWSTFEDACKGRSPLTPLTAVVSSKVAPMQTVTDGDATTSVFHFWNYKELIDKFTNAILERISATPEASESIFPTYDELMMLGRLKGRSLADLLPQLHTEGADGLYATAEEYLAKQIVVHRANAFHPVGEGLSFYDAVVKEQRDHNFQNTAGERRIFNGALYQGSYEAGELPISARFAPILHEFRLVSRCHPRSLPPFDEQSLCLIVVHFTEKPEAADGGGGNPIRLPPIALWGTVIVQHYKEPSKEKLNEKPSKDKLNEKPSSEKVTVLLLDEHSALVQQLFVGCEDSDQESPTIHGHRVAKAFSWKDGPQATAALFEAQAKGRQMEAQKSHLRRIAAFLRAGEGAQRLKRFTVRFDLCETRCKEFSVVPSILALQKNLRECLTTKLHPNSEMCSNHPSELVDTLARASSDKAARPPEYFVAGTDYDAALRKHQATEAIAFGADQIEAMTSCLTHWISLVQGPPGCGKTFLAEHLAILLPSLCASHLKIAIVTYKNHSLDEILLGIHRRRPRMNLIRIGGKPKKSVGAATSGTVDLEDEATLEEMNLNKKSNGNVPHDIYKRVVARLHDAERRLRLAQGSLYDVTPATAVDRELPQVLDALRLSLSKAKLHPMVALALWLNHVDRPSRKEIDEACRENAIELGLMDAAVVDGEPSPADDGGEKVDDGGGNTAEAKAEVDDTSSEDGFSSSSDTSTSSDQLAELEDEQDREIDHGQETFSKKKLQKFRDERRRAQTAGKAFERLKTILPAEVGDAAAHRSLDDVVKKLYYDYMERGDARQLWGDGVPLDQRRSLVRYIYDRTVEKCTRIHAEAVQEYREAKEEKANTRLGANAKTLTSADVIGLTATACATRQRLMAEVNPNVWIFEEAAEIPEHLQIACFGTMTKHIIMVGDHQQLRPVVASFAVERACNLKFSLFERLARNHFPLVTLSVQRRMHADISKLVRPFYPRIEDHESVSCDPRCDPASLQSDDPRRDYVATLPVLWPHLTSSRVVWWSHNAPESQLRGIINIAEVDMVHALVALLVSNGVPQNRITVLSYYLGQTRKLRETIIQNSNKKIAFEKVHVSTVDRFQGDENDFVIVSLVRQRKATIHMKLQNRMIVALSRARLGLFIIGSLDLLDASNELPHWNKIIAAIPEAYRSNVLRTVCCRHDEDGPVWTKPAVKHWGNLGQPGSASSEPPSVDPALFPALPTTSPAGSAEPTESVKNDVTSLKGTPGHSKRVLELTAETVPRFLKELGSRSKAVATSGSLHCQQQCTAVLPCGHRCALRCHAIPNVAHNCMQTQERMYACGILEHGLERVSCVKFASTPPTVCTFPVDHVRDCGHSEPIKCCIMDSCHPSELESKLQPCRQRCEVVLECKHIASIPCNKDPQTHRCTHPVSVGFPNCDHEVVVKCFQRHTPKVLEAPCRALVEYKHRSCKHRVELQCHEVVHQLIPPCNVGVEFRHPACGHTETMACGDVARNNIKPCSAEVELPVRRCRYNPKHKVSVRCSEASTTTLTSAECTELMSCDGVSCPNCSGPLDGSVLLPCGQFHAGGPPPCQRDVPLPLPCGHVGIVPCNSVKNAELAQQLSKQCHEPCKRLRPCLRHNCTKKCYEEPCQQCCQECIVREARQILHLEDIDEAHFSDRRPVQERLGSVMKTFTPNVNGFDVNVIEEFSPPLLNREYAQHIVSVTKKRFTKLVLLKHTVSDLPLSSKIRELREGLLQCEPTQGGILSAGSYCLCEASIEMTTTKKKISSSFAKVGGDGESPFRIIANVTLSRRRGNGTQEAPLSLYVASHPDRLLRAHEDLAKHLSGGDWHRALKEAEALGKQSAGDDPLAPFTEMVVCLALIDGEHDAEASEKITAIKNEVVRALCASRLGMRATKKSPSTELRQRVLLQWTNAFGGQRVAGFDRFLLPAQEPTYFDSIPGSMNDFDVMYEWRTSKKALRLPISAIDPIAPKATPPLASRVVFDPQHLEQFPSLKELSMLEGLQKVKEAIKGIVSEVLIDQRQPHKAGPCGPNGVGHFLFIGNPGTGKTTVAKILVNLFFELGVIPPVDDDEKPNKASVPRQVLSMFPAANPSVPKVELTEPIANETMRDLQRTKSNVLSGSAPRMPTRNSDLWLQGRGMQDDYRALNATQAAARMATIFSDVQQKYQRSVDRLRLERKIRAFITEFADAHSISSPIPPPKPSAWCTTGSEILNLGAEKFEEKLNPLAENGGLLFIDETYQLDVAAQGRGDGKRVMNLLLTKMENQRAVLCVIMAGYQREMEALMKVNQGLPSRIKRSILFEDYNMGELRNILLTSIKSVLGDGGRVDNELTLSIAAQRLVSKSGVEGFGNARAARNVIDAAKVRQRRRLSEGNPSRLNNSELYTLTRADMLGPVEVAQLDKLFEELHAMTGLREVKRQIVGDAQLMLKARMEEEAGNTPAQQVFHRVFLGNPGTGKTTLARLYAQILHALGAVPQSDFKEVRPQDLKGQFVGQTAKSVIGTLEAAEGKVLFIDEAYTMAPTDAGNDPFNTEMVDTLVGQVHGTSKDRVILFMAGYKKEMLDMFNNVNPGLKRRMQLSNAFDIADYTAAEMDIILRREIKNRGYVASRNVVEKAVDALIKQQQQPHFGNVGAIKTLLAHAFKSCSQRTVPPQPRLLTVGDFIAESSSAGDSKQSRNLEKLEQYPSLRDWISKIKRRRDRQQRRGTQSEPEDLCFLFTGNPGTGKTTGARLIGSFLQSEGLLVSSEVYEQSVTDLQTGYVGQAGKATKDMLQRARGGVLFIDEAYRLDDAGLGFGKQVIEELCDAITKEEFRGKVAIVLAGYPTNMQKLLNTNPGLQSRFNNIVTFDDFDDARACEIFVDELQKRRVEVTFDASDSDLIRVFERARTEIDGWANGRDILNIAKKCEEDIEHDDSWTTADVDGVVQAIIRSRPKSRTEPVPLATEPPPNPQARFASQTAHQPAAPIQTAEPPSALSDEKNIVERIEAEEDISDSEEAEAMTFGTHIQDIMTSLRISPSVVSKYLEEGKLPPEIERELRSKGMTKSDIERALRLHSAMIAKKRRIMKVKFCTVCGRTECNFRPVSFDVEVDD